jgi:hypothetical protein
MVDIKQSQWFETFCRSLLDKLQSARGVTASKLILEEYLRDWRINYGLDYYDPIRLLMPIVF